MKTDMQKRTYMMIMVCFLIIGCSDKHAKLNEAIASDPVRLAALYRAGNIPARFLVGDRYLTANTKKRAEMHSLYGVTPTEAQHNIIVAANGGNDYAQNILIQAFSRGDKKRGLGKDHAQYTHWLKRKFCTNPRDVMAMLHWNTYKNNYLQNKDNANAYDFYVYGHLIEPQASKISIMQEAEKNLSPDMIKKATKEVKWLQNQQCGYVKM